MREDKWLEIPVLIHGVDPRMRPEGHGADYASILNLINRELKKQGKKPFSEKPIAVEWGWDSGQSKENDRYLAQAERIIAEKVERAEKKVKSYFFARLLHKWYEFLRKGVFLTGVADMFYYVSQDGETAVRNNVFNHIAREITKRRQGKDKRISLTFIAHSAGTVIAHDLLYHFFGRKGKSPVSAINSIRKLAEAKKLRIRRVFTLSSPITPLMLRSNTLLHKVIRGMKLDPEDIGLQKKDKLSNPRWINFWDKYDIISFPLEFSYKRGGGERVVRDETVDLKGFLFWKVHNRYWRSREVARRIARVF